MRLSGRRVAKNVQFCTFPVQKGTIESQRTGNRTVTRLISSARGTP
jgi:hypothetical protein